MKRHYSALLALLLLHTGLIAQTSEQPFTAGIWSGITQYNGDLGQGFYYSGNDGSRLHLGASASWYISPRLDFSTNATVGSWGYTEPRGNSFEARQLQFNGHFRIKLFADEVYKVNPFALVIISRLSCVLAHPLGVEPLLQPVMLRL